MTTFISRRQFLRADIRAQFAALRPPWAQREDVFVDACTRCGACLSACPHALLHADISGFPAVDFAHAACDFCAACVDVCTSAALTRSSLEFPLPWQAKARIDDRCLTHYGVFCEVCRDRCATRAILFQPVSGQTSRPHINVSDCNGCGACVRACPGNALQVARLADDRALINAMEVSCT